MPTIVVLSGNPRPSSTTSAVARSLAEAIARSAPSADIDTLELSDLGSRVLDPAASDVAAARDRVAAADLVIVGSPVYKGSYTGLLKAFIDGYGPRSLAGVAAVPLIVAGSPAHAGIAAHIHLRPLLHEVGAETPLGVFAVLDGDVAAVDDRARLVGEWAAQRAPLTAALLAGGAR